MQIKSSYQNTKLDQNQTLMSGIKTPKQMSNFSKIKNIYLRANFREISKNVFD